ncbi:MAG TPA: sialidase family protein [Mycobacteriales bacterium]|nr:sialidase family protein [Mycobacteriales bacterium]
MSPLSLSPLSRNRWRLLMAAGVAATLAVPPMVDSAGVPADAASGSSIAIPTSADQTARIGWTGTIPPGSNANNDCTGQDVVDKHPFTLQVPAGVYDRLNATMTVTISWKPAAVEDVADEILTLLGPDGKTISSSDGGNPQEQITLLNPAAGTYTAVACGFVNVQPQDYRGAVTITTARQLHYPRSDAQGLKFSATVPADPQRDEGEPAITTDLDGNMYTCGPTGFSQMNDYAEVSTDGGDQFHLVGTPPRGQIGHLQAGGDCALATAKQRNAQGHYQLAYGGLGPLTGFSTATSADVGRTLVGSPDSESIPAVDRQWLAFSDAKTVFLNYNHTALGQVVQKSTDGGLTYSPPVVAATDGSRIGQIRVIPKSITGTKPYVYFPYDAGTKVKIALSKDGGDTWSQCVAVDAEAPPSAGFTVADNDRKGNVYVTYAEKGAGRDTYLVAIKFAKFQHCAGPNAPSDSAKNDVNPGFTPKIRMNRGGVETTVMPWVTASGKPGRVAVAYYGTNREGDPDSPDFHTSWFVWVSQTVDAFARTPHVGQVRASTHPFHYDSICLNGLGCDIAGADRSLVDYFTMDYDRKRGGLVIVYSQANKRPGDVEGVISIPAVVTQVAGPSNGGGTVDRAGRKPLRQSSPDPAGDAISRYSITNLGVALRGPGSLTVPALDLVNRNGERAVTIGRRKGGGFMVTMRFKNLSPAALQQAIDATSNGQPGSLVYAFRFFSGYRPVAAVATYDAQRGFRFGFSRFAVSTNCGGGASTAEPGSVGGKCETYTGQDAPLKGIVDRQSNSIRLYVPASYLRGLGDGLRLGRPYPGEVRATAGTRMYDGTAFTFVNDSSLPQVQTWMQQVDNAPAFDFRLPRAL